MIQCHKLTKADQECIKKFHQGKCTYLGHGRKRCQSKPVAWVYVFINYIDIDVDYYICRKHLLSLDADITRKYKKWWKEEVESVEREMYAASGRIGMFYWGYKYN